MADHTIWLGPVASFQVSGAVVPGSQLHVLQFHNASQAAPLLARWFDGQQYLPNMYAELGIAPGDNVFFGSFSAGHNVAKAITKAPGDRAMIRALMLADSAQSSWADAAHTRGVPPDGYVAFGIDCVTGSGQLMIASDSTHGDGSYAPSSMTMLSILDAIAAATGGTMGPSALIPVDIVPPPLSVASAGDLAALDYGQTISHEAHALVLAPVLWQRVLTPWYQAGMQNAFWPVGGGGGDGGGDGNPTDAPATSSGGGGIGVGTVLGFIGLLGLGALAYKRARRS